MKKLLVMFYSALLSILLFALEISPNLIYQIDTSKYRFTYDIFIKNDVPGESNITIEVIDFVTDGKYYSYDEPNYKYSLRQYVSVRESSILLGINEQKQVRIDFNVPQDFPGAMGVFALKITQESTSGGKVQIRLNYVVPFFVRFTPVSVFQFLKINHVVIKDLSLNPDEEYGDFGTLLTIEVENRGNIAFIPKGNLQISSRELRTIVSELPVDSFDLVVFPEKKAYYTVFIPYTLPVGTIDISLVGKSYGLDFNVSFSKKNTLSSDVFSLTMSPLIVLFTERTKNSVYSIAINNLSYIKDNLNIHTTSENISFTPKKSTIYPYKGISINVRNTLKNFDFSGDLIYPVELWTDSERKLRVISPAYVVLRGNSINPSLKAVLNSSQTSSTLSVVNDGDCVVEFNVLYNNQRINENPLIIFPGQTINLDFGKVIRSALLKIEYKAYGEEKRKILEDF
ncbi:hypothetical protein [Fervidobacterium sp.]